MDWPVTVTVNNGYATAHCTSAKCSTRHLIDAGTDIRAVEEAAARHLKTIQPRARRAA